MKSVVISLHRFKKLVLLWTHCAIFGCTQGFGVETWRKRPLERYRRGWEIILKWILKKWDGGAWTGLTWLRIGKVGRLLWTRQWTFRFHKMRKMSWLVEKPVSFLRRALLHRVIWCYRYLIGRNWSLIHNLGKNRSSKIMNYYPFRTFNLLLLEGLRHHIFLLSPQTHFGSFLRKLRISNHILM